jgi:hypothetical protein
MKNPALVQEPRYEPAVVIPLKQEASLLDWLKASNRLIARESIDKDLYNSEDDLEALMDSEEDFEEPDTDDFEPVDD